MREDGSHREVAVWLRVFEGTDAERLAEFLAGKSPKGKSSKVPGRIIEVEPP